MKVSPGMLLDVEHLPEAAGQTVRLGEVLAVRSEQGFKVGQPLLKGAVVVAEVLDHPRGPKVVSFKYKRRKGYRRKVGHRQRLTRLKIVEITADGA